MQLILTPKAHKLVRIQTRCDGRGAMKTMRLSEVKTKLSELVDAVERRDEVVTITRNGKPVAIIVSKDEYDGWLFPRSMSRPRFVISSGDCTLNISPTYNTGSSCSPAPSRYLLLLTFFSPPLHRVHILT